LPKYVKEGEAIEGEKIFCTFKLKPSIGTEKETKRQEITITGNPATASIDKVWKYKNNQ